jgi:hypothetical protein
VVKSDVGRLSSGTRVTGDYARMHGSPFLVVALDGKQQMEEVLDWVEFHDIKALSVAGPRECKCPRVYPMALDFLWQRFKGATRELGVPSPARYHSYPLRLLRSDPP